ncbi:aminotransferase class V-fold PLP-dependent enzyme [Candidatus Neomarinimicrobiota bacterium]
MDIKFVRKQFPGLNQNFIFMDNAGGSQILGSAIARIDDYLINTNVQLGASYEISKLASERLRSTTKRLSKYINSSRTEEIVIGSSSSMLLRILSICLSRKWKPGDEVVITNSDHEANISCWTDLQKKGIIIKIWKIDPDTYRLDISDLLKLITKKTKLVAMAHVSNILGTINPIKEISDIVHSAGALLCIDGVAYAPHRFIDVQAFGADFYVFSAYKVYGPHISILYGKYDLLAQLDGINHYFFDKNYIPEKFQPGSYNYELAYSLSAVIEYFEDLHDHHFREHTTIDNKQKYSKIFSMIAEYEDSLTDPLLTYINNNPKLKIVGEEQCDRARRVPTISFIHNDRSSSELVELVDNHRIGIRYGDFYAKKIIHDLNLEKKNGVIRVSLVHYNTFDEVSSLINILEKVC